METYSNITNIINTRKPSKFPHPYFPLPLSPETEKLPFPFPCLFFLDPWPPSRCSLLPPPPATLEPQPPVVASPTTVTISFPFHSSLFLCRTSAQTPLFLLLASCPTWPTVHRHPPSTSVSRGPHRRPPSHHSPLLHQF